MTTLEIILTVLSASLLIGFVCMTISLIKVLKVMKSTDVKTDKVKIVDGVRYTKDDVVERHGDMRISHSEGDVTLLRGEEYTVEKSGFLMPGKYTVLSADGGENVFNIRVGGFVREFSHNTPIVLAEGDEVCAVSHTVVLR